MKEQYRIHGKETYVRCATFGHNIGWVITDIHVHGIDNALSLGFAGALIVKYVVMTLKFFSRHDVRIDNKNYCQTYTRNPTH